MSDTDGWLAIPLRHRRKFIAVLREHGIDAPENPPRELFAQFTDTHFLKHPGIGRGALSAICSWLGRPDPFQKRYPGRDLERVFAAETALYRHFDAAGTLLYVGISINPSSRTRAHEGWAKWFRDVVRIEIERFPSRHEALAAELQAIRTERPLHNKVGSVSD